MGKIIADLLKLLKKKLRPSVIDGLAKLWSERKIIR